MNHGGMLARSWTSPQAPPSALRFLPGGLSSIETKVSYLKALRADSGDIDVHGRVLQIGRRVPFAEAHARNRAANSSGTPQPAST